jgi:hypothetical protein
MSPEIHDVVGFTVVDGDIIRRAVNGFQHQFFGYFHHAVVFGGATGIG